MATIVGENLKSEDELGSALKALSTRPVLLHRLWGKNSFGKHTATRPAWKQKMPLQLGQQMQAAMADRTLWLQAAPGAGIERAQWGVNFLDDSIRVKVPGPPIEVAHITAVKETEIRVHHGEIEGVDGCFEIIRILPILELADVSLGEELDSSAAPYIITLPDVARAMSRGLLSLASTPLEA